MSDIAFFVVEYLSVLVPLQQILTEFKESEQCVREGVKPPRVFYGQADRKPDRKQM